MSETDSDRIHIKDEIFLIRQHFLDLRDKVLQPLLTRVELTLVMGVRDRQDFLVAIQDIDSSMTGLEQRVELLYRIINGRDDDKNDNGIKGEMRQLRERQENELGKMKSRQDSRTKLFWIIVTAVVGGLVAIGIALLQLKQ